MYQITTYHFKNRIYILNNCNTNTLSNQFQDQKNVILIYKGSVLQHITMT